MSDSKSFETLAIHAGQEPDPSTGATVPPIHLTSTFTQEGLGQHKGFGYSRVANPTRSRLEETLAALEDGAACGVFGSGMAAIDALLRTLSPGDGVIAGAEIYGGTHRLLEKTLRPWGLEVAYAASNEADAYHDAARRLARPRLFWAESPTNPILGIVDIAAVAEAARESGCKLAVDNTFATPYLQRPLHLGADFSLHSMTKYLGGHSDIVGGAVIAKSAADFEPIRFLQKNAGAILSPFECWLVQRGIKTLAVRMDRHCENARRFAEAARAMKGVQRAFYPGFNEHPGHAIASRQMRDFGGMVSVEFQGGTETVENLARRLRVFAVGESLGGVESLASHPATMSHAGMSPEERAERGIGDGLVRFSVGLESVDDLIADVQQALG